MPASLSKVKTAKSQDSLKRILNDKKKRMRLFLLAGGILLLILGFSLSPSPAPSTGTGTNQREDVTSFQQEPVTVDKNLLTFPKIKEKVKNPPLRIVIPTLDLDVAIKEAKVVKGYWEVFGDSAGFGLGSAFPDEAGNQVIFAHARAGLFLPLRQAKIDQSIYILTKDSWYAYKITEIKEVLPNQTEVIAPTKEAVLTLYTCSGFADSKRLIVIAKRI